MRIAEHSVQQSPLAGETSSLAASQLVNAAEASLMFRMFTNGVIVV
jgi:hypothetical protein